MSLLTFCTLAPFSPFPHLTPQSHNTLLVLGPLLKKQDTAEGEEEEEVVEEEEEDTEVVTMTTAEVVPPLLTHTLPTPTLLREEVEVEVEATPEDHQATTIGLIEAPPDRGPGPLLPEIGN